MVIAWRAQSRRTIKVCTKPQSVMRGNVQSEDQNYCLALQSLKSLTVVCSSSPKVKEHKVEVVAAFLPISADEEESNAETRYFALLLLRNGPLLKYHTHDRRS